MDEEVCRGNFPEEPGKNPGAGSPMQAPPAAQLARNGDAPGLLVPPPRGGRSTLWSVPPPFTFSALKI